MTDPLRLPSDDRDLSPYTGCTRGHWEAAADGLVRAAWRWATPGGALLDLPGRPSRSGVRSDGLEGYARTFLAAAFRAAGADGADGADPYGLLGRYADGLATGTRTPGREDAESWPLVLGHHVRGQPMVESASAALGLRLTAAPAGRTALLVALASLTGADGPEPLTGVAAVEQVAGDAVAVRWADDGALTRIAFTPLVVTHGTAQPR